MSSLNGLVDVMARYLQSTGTSLHELASEANDPPEQPDDTSPMLSPSQMTRLWQLLQERMGPSPGISQKKLSQKVHELITRQLETGRARAAVIADQLNMSRQTLYKRLKAENQTFAALLDRVRREQALNYLQDPDRSLTEMAQRLGFSELSAFSRAFKRWMGQSPAQYRAGSVTAS
ncbi:helix-turn-helix transcriptional regulator [Elongatibacter sediminis]|uniref:Helix-turn-helix domain-containing protein n=1 Tax=Elongatibacter sediminis TaxID=3119006 RepID=A0AAW9R9U2_9GAMM